MMEVRRARPDIIFQVVSVELLVVWSKSEAEGGSNAGSNLGSRYNDTGTFQEVVFNIERSTGSITSESTVAPSVGAARTPSCSFAASTDMRHLSSSWEPTSVRLGPEH